MIKITMKGNLGKEVQAAMDRQLKQSMEKLRASLAEATPVDTGEAQQGWVIEGNSIVNRVDHIGVLNNGTSQQAPEHFIEKTLLAHEGVIPNGTIVRSE